MSLLNSLWNEIVGFFGVSQFFEILSNGEFGKAT